MIIKSEKPIILQPVDSPRRDLEAKIVQAAYNANAGFTTVIGKKSLVIACQKESRNAFWVGRLSSNDGRTPRDRRLCEGFEQAGTRLYFHHDEGAFHPKIIYRNAIDRIHPLEYHSRSFLASFLVWGEIQKRLCVELCPESEEKIKVSGAPRFDLYAPQYEMLDKAEVEDIYGKYGTFVLFCSQFKDFNFGPDEIRPFSSRHAALYSYGFRSESVVARAMMENWRFCGEKFTSFLHLILEAAASFPEVNMVIRVHPSEDNSIYHRLASHFGNISVVQDGDIRPYLRAARVVVHSESTTGVEALIAQKPTVNWTASSSQSQYAIMGAGEAGLSVSDLEKGIGAIEQGLNKSKNTGTSVPGDLGMLGGYLENLQQPSIPWTCHLLDSESNGVEGSFVKLPSVYSFRRWLRSFRAGINKTNAGGRWVSFREFPLEDVLTRLNVLPDHRGKIFSLGDDHIVIGP